MWEDGTKWWHKNGKLHREGGPAIEDATGEKEWRINGKKHRTDGPAVIYANGEVEYWINDIRTYKEAVEVYAALFPKIDL
jgi:hypothetical protein